MYSLSVLNVLDLVGVLIIRGFAVILLHNK